jgi:hypothetical protein
VAKLKLIMKDKMKTMLLTLAALGLALSLANAQAVDEWTFFSGAHLGMTIKEFAAYYDPMVSSVITHRPVPPGQLYIDFRSYGSSEPYHDWRVLVHFRESDAKIVSIEYWNASGKFSSEEIRHLKDLNKGYPGLITRLYNDGNDEELDVTTAAQDKLEDEAFKPSGAPKH